jgi:phosphate transport system permease protein
VSATPSTNPISPGQPTGQPVGQPHQKRRGRSKADAVLGLLTRGSAVAILLMVASLLGVLLHAAWPSIRQFGPSFIVSSEWRPNAIERPLIGPDGKVVIEDGETVLETLPPAFGALPVIYGTAVSAAIALLLAVPLSLGSALFIVRVASRYRFAGVVSFLIEFLAAIPSIAYGMWGIFVLTPFLQKHLEPMLFRLFGDFSIFGWAFFDSSGRAIGLTGRDMLCGGLILGIMILPIITAVSRDVLRAVPRAQVEGALALGATWWQSCIAMLRYSRSGLFGAVMLGLSRAAGETMAVTMVIGNNNQISPSPFAPAQTMASLLANEFGDVTGELHRSALLQVALILLIMSLVFNITARRLVVGKGSRSSAAH